MVMPGERRIVIQLGRHVVAVAVVVTTSTRQHRLATTLVGLPIWTSGSGHRPQLTTKRPIPHPYPGINQVSAEVTINRHHRPWRGGDGTGWISPVAYLRTGVLCRRS